MFFLAFLQYEEYDLFSPYIIYFALSSHIGPILCNIQMAIAMPLAIMERRMGEAKKKHNANSELTAPRILSLT